MYHVSLVEGQPHASYRHKYHLQVFIAWGCLLNLHFDTTNALHMCKSCIILGIGINKFSHFIV